MKRSSKCVMRMTRECGLGSALLWSIDSWPPVLLVSSFRSFIGMELGVFFFLFAVSQPGVM